MTPKQRAQAVAKRLGATIEVNDPWSQDVMDVEAMAPDGFRWAGEEIHGFVATAARGGTGAAWTDLAERMEAAGLEPCPADCECKEAEDEELPEF